MQMKENRTKNEYSRRGKVIVLVYVLGALGLVLLIAAAFLGPKIVFAMQDDIRCRAIVSVSPEEMDITSFNTGYETDLYKRLARFSEGLAKGEQYYVTVQDMEITPEMRKLISSDDFWYSNDSIRMALNLDLLLGEMSYYELTGWKRCVIYGDDYAGGVNFILWYLELSDKGETPVRLLMDGETGDVYGIRTDFSSLFSESAPQYVYSVWSNYFDITDEAIWQMCIVLSDQYGGLDDLMEMLKLLEAKGYGFNYTEDNIIHAEVYDAAEREQIESELMELIDILYLSEEAEYQAEEIQNMLQGLYWQVSEDEKRLDFYFPYGGSSLDLRFQLDGDIRVFKRWGTHYMDMTFGFPEIYERIPAFMGD